MQRTQKWLSLLLAALMLLSTLTAALAATLPIAAEENIASDEPVKLNAYDTSLPGRSAKAIADDYCIRLNLGAPFTAFSISMPTWSAADSEATVAIYKWNKSYDDTIKADPIASEHLAPLKDNAYNGLTFDEQPAGEYLFRIYNVTGKVGVWAMDHTVSKGYCYIGGQESTADWEMNISFSKTPIEPFLACAKAEAPKGDHVAPPEYEIPADSLIYTHEVMPDTWVFTDGLGRTSLTNADVGDPREDRTLAMFYWTWHAELAWAGATNTTELISKYPDAKNDYNHPAWTGTGHYCFWNEPIYGFYRTDDAWVLRRQAELLANAGVDTIFTDNTNGNMTWRSSYMALYETWDDAQKNGAVNVPKVSYLLPFGPNGGHNEQVLSLYNDVYRPGKYQNLWFYWEDKPMLMAYNTSFNVKSDASLYEIYNFFTWRSGQPEYRVGNTAIGQWGWLSVYPQAVYYGTRENRIDKVVEQMTVGVGVNHNYVTKEITAMNGVNVMGRSYTSDYEDRYEKEGAEASKWGYQFSEQFKYALETDPKVIFVTGWNEWHAWRQPSPWGGANSQVSNALVDQFDDEHSRDLEPTKGALQDHYYYLFVNYARQYKGVRPIPTPSEKTTIDLSAGHDQWANVAPYYAAYIGNTADRDAKGYGNLTYTETSGRNDIIGAQVARDDEYVYFHVECAADITPYTDPLWMTLYIDSNQETQGWNTFEYVVNKSAASADTLVLEKFTADNDYAKTERVADVDYKVDGRYMTVKIKKADLGLTDSNFTINFAWTDNVHDEGDYSAFSGDIMDFYISGDVAPGGRFKYSYISTAANAGEIVETEPVTTPDTEPATDPTDETPTEASTTPATESQTEAQTDASKSGCQSAVGMSAAALILLCGAAFVTRRKHN